MKCWSSPKHASQTHMPMLLNRDFFCVRPISRIAQNWGRPGTAPHPMPGIAEYVHTPHGFPGLGARNVYTLRAANTPFFGSRAFTQASMSRTRYQSNQPPPPKVRSTTTSTGEVWSSWLSLRASEWLRVCSKSGIEPTRTDPTPPGISATRLPAWKTTVFGTQVLALFRLHLPLSDSS